MPAQSGNPSSLSLPSKVRCLRNRSRMAISPSLGSASRRNVAKCTWCRGHRSPEPSRLRRRRARGAPGVAPGVACLVAAGNQRQHASAPCVSAPARRAWCPARPLAAPTCRRHPPPRPGRPGPRGKSVEMCPLCCGSVVTPSNGAIAALMPSKRRPAMPLFCSSVSASPYKSPLGVPPNKLPRILMPMPPAVPPPPRAGGAPTGGGREAGARAARCRSRQTARLSAH